MIRKVLKYYCPTIPTVDDLNEALNIAYETCAMIELNWTVYNGDYTVMIHDKDTLASIKNKMPKVYGL